MSSYKETQILKSTSGKKSDIINGTLGITWFIQKKSRKAHNPMITMYFIGSFVEFSSRTNCLVCSGVSS